MLFTSLEFFVFLPVVLAVFAALPVRWRWLWLLAASYAFYGASHPANLLYLGAITALVIACAQALAAVADERARRAVLAVGLAGIIGALAAFKFYDFAAAEIERSLGMQGLLPRLGAVAPAGFSFYAFSAASYLIDAWARRLPAGAHSGAAALYLAWFPKILAGPIERGTSFLPQLQAGLRLDPERAALALQLIGWGLFKKVAIADNLAPMVDKAFGIAAYASPVELLVSVYFFAFQIYCDFSGYTDIALGISALFGLQLMENFRRPYFARSTGEFWAERWHISLGRWFRDYLYIPLGGSRAGMARRYLNLMLVFVASGLWHAGLGYGVGWTFLVWGALNGAYVCGGVASRPLWSRLGEKLPRVGSSVAWKAFRILITFHLIAFSWIFFRARSLADAWTIVRKIGTRAAEIPSLLAAYPFTFDHYLGASLIALLVVFETLDERRPWTQRLAAAPAAVRWGAWYAGLIGLLLLGRWQVREFIYMQF